MKSRQAGFCVELNRRAWTRTGAENERTPRTRRDYVAALAPGERLAQASDDQPQAGDDHPQAGDDQPRPGDDHPQAGDDQPQAGDDHPRPADEFVLPGDEDAFEMAAPARRTHPVPGARPMRPPRPTFLDRRASKRLRARKVRRLVRHVEPWSVLKLSLIFYFCLWVILLIAGVILWNLAVSSGTIDNIENFIEQLFALESFAFNGDQIFRAAAVGGLVLVVAGSGFTVLMAVLFNLISDITGGVRMTVVEEETARPRPRRTRPRRGIRPTPAFGTPMVPPGDLSLSNAHDGSSGVMAPVPEQPSLEPMDPDPVEPSVFAESPLPETSESEPAGPTPTEAGAPPSEVATGQVDR